MKKLLFLLLLIPFLGTSQGTFTAPVGYNTGAPTAAPSGVGTRWRFDLLTGKKYTWNPDAVAWDEDARGIDQVSGCSAPLYTPGYNQSTFAVNACSPTPELYQYTGSSWVKLNPGGSYTAGANIDITGNVISLTGNLPVERFNGGTNAASNTYWRGDGLWASLPGFLTSLNGLSPAIQTFATSTAGTDFSIQSFGSTHTFRLPTASATNRGALSSADWSTFNSKDPSSTNEIQTLSIAGNDLTLSDGGGTVTLPGGGASDALGTGFVDGGGNGTIPEQTVADVAVYSGWGDFKAQFIYDYPSYIQSLADGFRGFGFQVYNENTGEAYFAGSTEENPTEFQVVVTNGSQTGIYGFNPNTVTMFPASFLNMGGGVSTAINSPITAFSGGIQPASLSNAAAPNNTIFYSTTDSKLSYKDPAGVVHNLY